MHSEYDNNRITIGRSIAEEYLHRYLYWRKCEFLLREHSRQLICPNSRNCDTWLFCRDTFWSHENVIVSFMNTFASFSFNITFQYYKKLCGILTVYRVCTWSCVVCANIGVYIGGKRVKKGTQNRPFDKMSCCRFSSGFLWRGTQFVHSVISRAFLEVSLVYEERITRGINIPILYTEDDCNQWA